MGDLRSRIAAEERVCRLLEERWARRTRGVPAADVDLRLLQDTVSELARMGARLAALGAGDAEVSGIVETHRRYAALAAEVEAGQRAGRYLGGLANQQFAVYGRLFTGRPRRTRRPALLPRIIEELTRIRGWMVVRGEAERKNVSIVDGRIERYRAELAQLEQARSGLEPAALREALVGECAALSTEVEATMSRHRALVDPDVLDRCIDLVDELLAQIDELVPWGSDPALTALVDDLRSRRESWSESWRMLSNAPEPADVGSPNKKTPVRELVLHETFTRAEAILAVGAGAAVRSYGTLELLEIGPAIVCVAHVGFARERSHFSRPATFTLRLPVVGYRDELAANVAKGTAAWPIHVFARLPGDPTYLYAGKGEVVSHGKATTGGATVDIELAHRIPEEAWTRFGGADWLIQHNGRHHTLRRDDVQGFDLIFAASPDVPMEATVESYAGKLVVHAPPEDGNCRLTFQSAPGGEELVPSDSRVSRARALAIARAFFETSSTPLGLAPRRRKVARKGPPNRYLDRYLAGGYRDVWTDLCTLELDERGRALAMGVAEETMRRVRDAIDTLIVRLRELGYRFAAATPRAPLGDKARAHLTMLRRRVGPLPVSLEAFWEIVGTVDFNQARDQLDTQTDLHAQGDRLSVLGLLGPLEIGGPGFLLSSLGSDRPAAPVEVPFIAEDCTKAGFSGDYLYLSLPAHRADVFIRWCGKDHERFVDYLRAVIGWAGFRGHVCREHSDDQLGYHAPPMKLLALATRGLEPF